MPLQLLFGLILISNTLIHASLKMYFACKAKNNKMDKKQGTENTEFIKDEAAQKSGYLFQNNGITKTGAIIIIVFLIVLVIGLLVSGVLFEN